ncbi:MAG: glycine cleavage system protein H [Candidatus Wallbacteria bacterium GWC2_49_35]|jgi:glycine cleavage system H protein|uniref:Glycine cleavage system H protein n=1 Tax=Candidatus Wallbacteria bacterium GWC2_49_35 TaxID=1817813 RepID=A0A1F7WL41_9BACT|nr:MAG: glycine cleavage system protein H [Candidatus Wallbacteria bacterium GWC2_49_35]HBC76372.1 glycine cleavage system protein GcvH [Candidatus Wallbacteria bacterium]
MSNVEYNIPEDLRYTEQHEWLRIDGKTAYVGISDYAQHESGDIVYVEFTAEVNQSVDAHEKMCVVESSKAASDVYSPVSGKVVTLNVELEDNPEIINEDPYGDGWMFEIEMSNPSEAQELMSAAEYKKFIEEAIS